MSDDEFEVYIDQLRSQENMSDEELKTHAEDMLSRAIWLHDTLINAKENQELSISDLPKVVDMLDFPSQDIRYGAAEMIGIIARHHPTEVRPYISEIVGHLDDSDPDTKQSLLTALAQVSREEPESVRHFADKVIDEIDHGHSGVRVFAACTISYMIDMVDNKNAVGNLLNSLLTDILREENTELLMYVCAAIARVSREDPSACIQVAPKLLPLLASEDTDVRRNVVIALKHMQIVEARAKIEDLRRDENEGVRQAALDALRTIPETKAERSVVEYGEINVRSDMYSESDILANSGSGSETDQNLSEKYSQRKRELRQSLVQRH